MKKIVLDKDEITIEEAMQRNEWVAVPDMAEEINKYQSHARQFLNKNKKINIRLSEWDYNKIKIRAVEEGLPYQTLVSSLIHKYVTGQLKSG
jgi:predicted DNA binding CopG/RHH family protein